MHTRPARPHYYLNRIASVAALLALVVPLMSACVPTAPTGPTAAPAKRDAESTKPAESKPAESAAKPAVSTADIPSMTLKVADIFPPTGFIPEMRKWWADDITKRTDGKVQFQFFWSDSLFKNADAASNLNAGVADISHVASTYDPSKTELWMTLDMPFNARDYWCGISASYDVIDADPHLKG
jgi:TRAP-type C4-dicarboxylate transport system substrate-binding protein